MSDAASVPAAAPGGGPAESLSQWQLIRRRFARHRVAVVSLYLLVLLYLGALFAEFFAPYTAVWKNLSYIYCPPQPPRVSLAHGFHICAVEQSVDPVTYKKSYVERREVVVPLGFFVKGEPYRLWGWLPCERHFFGVDREAWRARNQGEPPPFYFFGSDQYGQDLLSRMIYGARI